MAENHGAGLIGAVIARAVKDPAYRKQLIQNPKAAIKQETGVGLPDPLDVKVLQDSEKSLHIVLPRVGSQGIQERVVSRATVDPEFRKQLLANPRAAIQREAGVELPAGIEINVVEELEKGLYVVLPPDAGAATPGAALSDQELEAVVGGGGCFLTTVGSSDCWTTKGDCCSTQADTQHRDNQSW